MKEKIGIFGGSFNPIHIGHLHIAEQMMYSLNLNRIFFVIDSISAHREKKILKVSYADRKQMLKIALKDNKKFIISDVPEKLKGPTYTHSVIKNFREKYNADELYFIMGMDSLNDIENWKNYKEIFKLANLAVFPRPGIKNNKKFIKKVIFVKGIKLNISSTDIRNSFRNGEGYRYLVLPEIYDYIRKNKLYVE